MNLTHFNWQKFCSGEIKIFDKEGHVLKIDMFGGDFIINTTYEHGMKTVNPGCDCPSSLNFQLA